MPDEEAVQQAATALVSAMVALREAQTSVELALACLQDQMPARDIKAPAAVRTTSVQVLGVLSTAGGAITLQDIADGVLAIRRGEDEPRPGGGTRYQEICRNALRRLIKQGIVERVEPTSKAERMRFRRVGGRARVL